MKLSEIKDIVGIGKPFIVDHNSFYMFVDDQYITWPNYSGQFGSILHHIDLEDTYNYDLIDYFEEDSPITINAEKWREIIITEQRFFTTEPQIFNLDNIDPCYLPEDKNLQTVDIDLNTTTVVCRWCGEIVLANLQDLRSQNPSSIS